MFWSGQKGPQTNPGLAPWSFVACYAEPTKGGRALPNGVSVPGGANNMTVENCCAACEAQGKGYNLAGVEYGRVRPRIFFKLFISIFLNPSCCFVVFPIRPKLAALLGFPSPDMRRRYIADIKSSRNAGSKFTSKKWLELTMNNRVQQRWIRKRWSSCPCYA